MPIRKNLSERRWGNALFDLDDDGLGALKSEDVDPFLRIQHGLLLNRGKVRRVGRLALPDALTEHKRVELVQVHEEERADYGALAVRPFGISLSDQQQGEVCLSERVVALRHALDRRRRRPHEELRAIAIDGVPAIKPDRHHAERT